MRIEDRFVLYYVAMTREPRVSAVGHAFSEDLIHWEDQGPVFAAPVRDAGTGMCESPCVIHAGGRWRLFFKLGFATYYAVSDTPYRFEDPAPLCVAHAAEVFAGDDGWLISECGVGGVGLARIEFDGDAARLRPF